MKASRALVAAGVLAVVLGMAGVGQAASPSSGAIGPSDPTDSWAGKFFALASTPSPKLCNKDACDYFDLSVGVSPSYWNDHTGTASVAISWKDSADNFDLYVYKGDQLVKSSTQLLSTSEAVSISKPSGAYQVLVVPVLVTNSGYSGSAKFSSQTKPKPPPPPSPKPKPSDPGNGDPGDPGNGGGGGGGGPGYSGGGSGPNFGPGPGPNYLPSDYYGGGTVYFGPQDRTVTSKDIYYGPGPASSAGPAKGSGGTQTRTQPVSATVPKLPQFVWLLLPLGMLLLAAAAYAVFEPEPVVAEEPLPEAVWRSEEQSLTPAPIALAGVAVRSAAALGRLVHDGVRRMRARRRKDGSAGT